jgi:ferritin
MEAMQGVATTSKPQDGGTKLRTLVMEQLKVVNEGQLGSAKKHFSRTGSYTDELQSGMNEMIADRHTFELQYDAMCAYFNRDNVGLPGSAYFFKILGLMERNDAQLFVDFNNCRGGTTIMTSIPAPEQDYMEYRSSADARKDLKQAFQLTLANNRAVLMRLQDLSQLALGQAETHMATFLGECMEARSELTHKNMGQAAAYESAAPCGLSEGAIPRRKKRMNCVVERNFENPTDYTVRNPRVAWF